MTEFGQKLIRAALEAQAIARGEAEPAGVYFPPQVDVRGVRKRLKLSQAAFADRFGLPVGTVRDWEQGRRTPDRPAAVLLAVIAAHPDAVVSALAAERAAG